MVAIQPLNPESVPVAFVFSREVAEALECIALEFNVSQSQVIEAWVLKYVKHREIRAAERAKK